MSIFQDWCATFTPPFDMLRYEAGMEYFTHRLHHLFSERLGQE